MAEETPRNRLSLPVIMGLAGSMVGLLGAVGALTVWVVTTSANYATTLERMSARIEAAEHANAEIRREASVKLADLELEIGRSAVRLQAGMARDREHFDERLEVMSAITRQDVLSRLRSCEDAAAKRRE